MLSFEAKAGKFAVNKATENYFKNKNKIWLEICCFRKYTDKAK